MYLTDNDLLCKNRLSCGRHCTAHKAKEDLTGQIFGCLTVRKPAGKDSNGYYLWECVCSCGKIVVKTGTGLKAGCYKSCGHILSYGEIEIEKILTEKKINFKKQYSFQDLRGPKNGRLKFDFAIFSENNNLKYLIEYQGKQHYIAPKNSYFGQMQREITDQSKREYCEKHNITLYEIRYNENIQSALEKILSEGG